MHPASWARVSNEDKGRLVGLQDGPGRSSSSGASRSDLEGAIALEDFENRRARTVREQGWSTSRRTLSQQRGGERMTR